VKNKDNGDPDEVDHERPAEVDAHGWQVLGRRG
jgi:hypothetical protein